jgi:hypothetical protein
MVYSTALCTWSKPEICLPLSRERLCVQSCRCQAIQLAAVDLGLALEAMKTLNIKEDVKVEAGGKFPVPVSRTNTETTESSLPSSSSSKDAAAKAA